MERIARCVLSSRYSIHDLSRCQGEGDQNFARFNMPLELGIAMGRSLSAETVDEDHDWLLLVPKGHSYAQFASDLAGYDAKQYEVTPESVVPAVMSWLMTRSNAAPGPTPKRVLEKLPRFTAAKEQLEIEWANDIPWSEQIIAAHAAAPT
jgi:predicted phosphoadenosine phosphosulfate sulfurtransferase